MLCYLAKKNKHGRGLKEDVKLIQVSLHRGSILNEVFYYPSRLYQYVPIILFLKTICTSVGMLIIDL